MSPPHEFSFNDFEELLAIYVAKTHFDFVGEFLIAR